MEILDPGMQHSTLLPAAANGAECCTLGHVVSGDTGPADSRLTPCCGLGGAPQPWQPASRPLRGGKALDNSRCEDVVGAGAFQLAALQQRVRGGKPPLWGAALTSRSTPLTDAHGEEGQHEHGGNLLTAACKNTFISSLSCQGKLLLLPLRQNFSLLRTWLKR